MSPRDDPAGDSAGEPAIRTAGGIRPFRLEVPEDDLADLRDRLARTRWPSLPGNDWDRGVPVDYLRGLAEYWRTGYDWRAAEAQLNALPQFTTTIDGTTVYFLHIESPEPAAVPLLLIHGWPGSVVEFLDVIGPLSDPAAHGGDPVDAFTLVIPAIPGFGLSRPVPDTGWSEKRAAGAFLELMTALGYERFAVQGGDMGAVIGPAIGRLAPERVIGVHVNAATTGFMPFPPVDDAVRDSMTDLERRRLDRINEFMESEFGYAQIQSTKPNTVAYGLTDSPVGQLAWIVEKFHGWTHGGRVPEDVIDRDRLLTDVMLYWLTGTAGTSAQMYYESARAFEWPTPSGVPTGVAVFAEDISIRRFAEQSNVIAHWTDFDTGGHFAALESPGQLVADVRTFLRPLRPSR